MIDPVKILRRAWHILWNYRTLWFFGLILALTAGGGGGNGGGGNSGYRFDHSSGGNGLPSGDRIEQWFRDLFQPLSRIPERQLITTLIWIGVGLLLFFLLIAIAFAVLRYVSETAVIRMVNEYENTGAKVGFRQGWRYGWSRASWRLFLINLLTDLPVLAFFLLALILGVAVFFMVRGGDRIAATAGVVGGIGIFLLLLLAVLLLEVVLRLMREFFWRACALENLGVMDSLRRGFDLVKRNWKSAGLMWLIMLGIGIAWVIVAIVAFFLLIPLYAVMAVPALIVAGIPAMLVYGIASLFLSTPLAVVVAAIVGVPFFFLITFSPLAVISGWMKVFESSVWTLTYREILGLESPASTADKSAAA